MRASFMTMVVLSLAACGKGSAEAPSGLDAAHVAALGAVGELATFLDDAGAARDGALAAVRARGGKAAELAAAMPAPALDFASRAGWEAAGLDASAGLAVVVDDRLARGSGLDDTPPILLVKVADPERLIAALAKLGVTARLEGAGLVRAVKVGDRTVALVGALGDRAAIVPIERRGLAEELAPRLEAILGGAASGQALGADPTWRTAMKLDGGPGLSVYVSIAGLRGILGSDDEALGRLVTAAGVHLGRDGLTIRVAPAPGSSDALARIYAGTADPPDLGRAVPAAGWAAARWSFDLRDGLDAAFTLAPVEGLLKEGLAASGLSLDEVRAALTGDVGLAVDLAWVLREGGPGGREAGWLAMLGVRDGDLADRLLAKLAELVRTRDVVTPRAVTAGGRAGFAFDVDRVPVVVVRDRDMLLVAPGEAALTAALERSPTLAGTPAGATLGRRGAFAFGGDLAPLVALVEREVGPPGTEPSFLGTLLLGMTTLPSWRAFRERPVITTWTGWDGDAAVTEVRDGGLLYGWAAGAFGGLAASIPAMLRAPTPPPEPGGAAPGDDRGVRPAP